MYFSPIKRLFAFLLIAGLTPFTALAQKAPTFQNFFLEGAHQHSVYGDLGITFSDFPGANFLQMGGRIGFPLGYNFELGITIDFLSIDPQFGDNIDGISDPMVVGRYLVQEGNTDISVGAGFSLPIGDEDVGGGDGVDFNLFGALRHYLNDALAIAGVLGIDFVEIADDYDASLRLGGAAIFRTNNPDLQLIGELTILSEGDFTLLTFGVDYRVSDSARLRPALGLGLDDGAPDVALALRLLLQ
ncbi:MAG: hypothetical protein KTR29_06685 [Rhodothermaceae bacterium]|nr:hypothetical protein [Rhodothermaceae bacterium]